MKKKLERYLRVNLFGPGRGLKKNLPGRGLTKVEKHCVIGQEHLEKQTYLWRMYILERAKIDSSHKNIKITLSWIRGTYCSVVPRDPDMQKSVEKESEKNKKRRLVEVKGD